MKLKIGKRSATLKKDQILAIKCAYADLVGAEQAATKGNFQMHDWKSHRLSIEELEMAFDFLDAAKINH